MVADYWRGEYDVANAATKWDNEVEVGGESWVRNWWGPWGSWEMWKWKSRTIKFCKVATDSDFFFWKDDRMNFYS